MIQLFLRYRNADSAIFQSEERAMFKACTLLNLHAVKAFIVFNKTFLCLKEPESADLLNTVILSSVQNSFDQESKYEIVRLLLQNGADPARLYRGQTSLELAKQRQLWNIVREIEVYMALQCLVANKDSRLNIC
jgi:hypothetical protein